MIIIERGPNTTPEEPAGCQLVYKTYLGGSFPWTDTFLLEEHDESLPSFLALQGWHIYFIKDGMMFENNTSLKIKILKYNGRYYSDSSFVPFIKEKADICLDKE